MDPTIENAGTLPGDSQTQLKRSDSPLDSCVSMKSESSMNSPPEFKDGDRSSGHSQTQLKRSDSPLDSCVSMKSESSMNSPPEFKDGDCSSGHSQTQLKTVDLLVHRSVCASINSSPEFKDGDPQSGHSQTQLKRSDSLLNSCVSMKSESSMNSPPECKDGDHSSGHSQTQLKRSDSLLDSCVSMKSESSMNSPPECKDEDRSSRHSQTQLKTVDLLVHRSVCASINSPPEFKDGDPQSGHSQTQLKRSDSPLDSCVSMKSESSMNSPPEYKDGDRLSGHSQTQLKTVDSLVHRSVCASINSPPEFKDGDSQSGHRYTSVTTGPHVQERCKLDLIKKFQHLNEVMTNQRNPTLLNEIYTDLYITEGDSGKVNKEHEVRQIEAASRRAATAETPIKCSEIFKSLSEEDKPIRIVLTKGVAGIGKTVSVQKLILDWAEGKTNQDVLLIFPLPFRELNLMKNKKRSLVDLLHFFLKEQKETNISRLDKVLFIFDGLDECRFPLDFRNTVRLCDVTEPASVDVLLINLIKGNLLPSALIWITSRPAAADQIPPECVDRVTEVRGFNDPQKEEYFRKRISDQNLSSRIITHLKSLRSLYIMCHIPVFCWISATVLERMLGEAESGEIPKTLTQMYTHFLIIQTNFIRKKYTTSQEADKEMLLKLGKLAFQQLMKGNLIFYEEDLMECGIDVTEASVYSGVCTQIFREEFGLHQSKVYCFVHLSIQEHLAALYVHLKFTNKKKNVLQQSRLSKLLVLLKKKTILDVHRSAVDQALQSKNGHLDLFLRFLLGLSMESNQNLLKTLVPQTGSSSRNKQETVHYIKMKIRENPSREKAIILFDCLRELEDHSPEE
ncbi:NACHT, LRR and PYD domains-containing protein 3-like isoform X1 [Silurus asotus]|uniref:NACHT, LRR and PYD domains-containing protein 3-like isoform X1 n=1 Tax=Silurus asotus TaxID=30991 RepID=A0AAD5F9E6_SILAS|nr:NACHT, LRR and PYD domains-containing protein 3-like isoform X1 [Silurus asotus]